MRASLNRLGSRAMRSCRLRPVVSIAMVAFGGGWRWVPRALEALRRNTVEPYEVILVDNGGAEDRPAPDDPNVTIVRNEQNVGFGPASNEAVRRARADVVCLLNTDVLVEPGWLPPLLERVQESGVGAVFPAKLNLDGTMQEAGAFVTGEANAYVFGDGDEADAAEYHFSREVDFGSAAAMCMMSRSFESLEGFDPAYRIAYYEDADLCFRLREHGLRLVYEPRARVIHARSVSAPPSALGDVYVGNRRVFLGRWRSAIEGRPTFGELDADPRVRLVARDFHAHYRVLVLGGMSETQRLARALALADPGSRVTLAADRSDRLDEDALLACGVEVARPERPHEWFHERAGHYLCVVHSHEERWSRFRAVLFETQPKASFVDPNGVEGVVQRVISTSP
jgi:GT2 family glycosyltransferase